MKRFKYNTAINYSGYRENQSPLTNQFPSKEEILEDLKILEGDYYYLRIYDCTPHAYSVLELIEEYNLNFKILLGLSMHAEENHVDHPFFYVHKAEVLEKNVERNNELVEEIISFANRYKSIVSAISIGNETRSIWNNSRVSEAKLVKVTKRIQSETSKPVTFCEEYQHWVNGLEELGKTVDFISLHTYPAWRNIPIEDSIKEAEYNYKQVLEKHPGKYCIITETGWPTNSHGAKIKKEAANISNQLIYNREITKWGKENDVLVYLFEAFDEPWKGENNPDEPEKNWGIYDVNRKLKAKK